MFELMLTKMTQTLPCQTFPGGIEIEHWLNLINNLTTLRLWQLKILLSEGSMNFKKAFLEDIQTL